MPLRTVAFAAGLKVVGINFGTSASPAGTNWLLNSQADSRPAGLFIAAEGVKVISMIIDYSSTPIFAGPLVSAGQVLARFACSERGLISSPA